MELLNCDKIISIIKDIQKKEQPFSLIRYGDGEARVLSMRKKEDYEYVFNRQFGHVPDRETINKISSSLLYAYIKSDIIGIPNPEVHEKPNMDYYWVNGTDILMDNLVYSSAIPPVFCSIDIHTDMLKKDLFKNLLQEQEEVYIISGRNIGDKLAKKYKIGKFTQWKVTPELKFEANKRQTSHFPDQYNQILNEIKEMDLSGKICLVGAGILGKIYCNALKESGGIAIDIGNVFDRWVGKVTRGPKRGVDSWDDEYKL